MAIMHFIAAQGRSALTRRYLRASDLPGGCIAALCMDEIAEPLACPVPAGFRHYPKGSGEATLGAPVERSPLQARPTTQIASPSPDQGAAAARKPALR